jgi:hypothetical protein
MIKVKGKRINPGKSNRLIWAVAAGLAVVFAAVFILTGLQRKQPTDRKALMLDTLAYLKRIPGIITILPDPEAGRVTLVYDGNFEGDFPKIARYAALRLSGKMDDVELTLARNRAEHPVYRIRLKGRTITDERVF